jgi:hypothetical protein
MKRTLHFIVIFAVVFTLFAVEFTTNVRSTAAKDCFVFDSNNSSLHSLRSILISGHNYTVYSYIIDKITGKEILIQTFTFTFNGRKLPRFRGHIIVIDHDCDVLFHDGRLNNDDAGETFAVYCKADGSVEVMAIYKGEGFLAFVASPAEIAAVPTHPATNTIIKQGKGAFLYRLTSGLLQVNRAEDGTPAKDYSFAFPDCAQP